MDMNIFVRVYVFCIPDHGYRSRLEDFYSCCNSINRSVQQQNRLLVVDSRFFVGVSVLAADLSAA